MFMIHASSIDVFEHLEVLIINLRGCLSLIVLQTDDRVGSKSGGTNIGRIQEGVIGEDHVIGGYRLAIGELHANAQAGGVLGGVSSFIVFD